MPFGRASPSGRLPVTFYRSVTDLPSFDDYRMAARTYSGDALTTEVVTGRVEVVGGEHP